MRTKQGDRTVAVLARLEEQIGQLLREGAVRGEVLERVETQVKLTNGRVSSLETWRDAIRGGVILAALLLGGLGWLLTYLFK